MNEKINELKQQLAEDVSAKNTLSVVRNLRNFTHEEWREYEFYGRKIVRLEREIAAEEAKGRAALINDYL